jgi:hypothetical protein
MLVAFRDTEERKHHDDHKDVINAQGFFDEISGEKLDRLLFSELIINKKVKQHCQAEPNARPC